jgi:long-subunit fatty acid transport protein
MNYDNEFFVTGTNTNSISSYFLNYAQGVPLDLLQLLPGETISDLYGFLGANEGYAAQQAFLGYQSFILEAFDDSDPNNTGYFSNVMPGDFNQEYSFVSSGYSSKFTFNLASQYKDKLYLGMNLNSHFINYNKSTYLYESNTNAGSIVNEVGFENNFSTIGTGFSFQLGAIAKLHKNLRLGASYQSPTWYRISEETTQAVATTRDDAGTAITDIISPDIINVFPTYRLQSPAVINGSAAILFGKKGLISFDYTIKDYAGLKFNQGENSDFTTQNNIISNSLKATSSYRIGGEYRINKALSLRGGYRFEESPYEEGNIISDLDGYSIGLGYNFGKIKLDATFDQFEQTRNQQLFSEGLTDSNRINAKNSNITISVSFNL